MREFFRRFLDAWRLTRFVAFVEDAETEAYWTDDDSFALQIFFQSITGRKLKTRLANMAIKSALQATYPNEDRGYACGTARGITLCVRAIETHLTLGVPAQADTTEEVDTRARDFLEKVGAV